MLEDDESVLAAMRAGARGYLLKGAGGAETMQAIRTVASGGAIFSPTVAQQVLRTLTARHPTSGNFAELFPELTERERDVLHLLAQGFTNTAIAERLYLGPKTVRNYVSNIFSKLQVVDRTQAALRAREAGLQ
jgi:DNA-binding NarL/FixJ family response regulator